MNSAGQLHRLDGPALVHTNGDAFWFSNGELHREDGPACELSDRGRTWWQNNKRHRADGPAIEYSNGSLGWYLIGREYTDLGEYCDAAGITGKHKTLFLLQYSGVTA